MLLLEHRPGLHFAVADEAGANVFMVQRQNLGGQERGVLGSPDRHRSDGDAARHLDDRKQGVESAELLGRNGHADDRHMRLRRQHAGEMGGASGSRDDNLHPPVGSLFGIGE